MPYLTSHEVRQKINSMKPGECWTYHKGSPYYYDRSEERELLFSVMMRYGSPVGFSYCCSPHADTNTYGQGLGFLVQRKIEEDLYEYMFIRAASIVK